MKVRFWGVRGSTPTPALENLRYGGNTPCIEIRTPDDRLFVFDCGTGFRLLGKQLLNEYGHKSIQAHIFLSHYHWDHIQGITFFEPLYNPENNFHFYSFISHAGSVQNVIEGQMSDPYFPVNMNIMKARRNFRELDANPVELDGMKVTALPLNHPQGCLGFRIEYEGHVVTYATDNEPGSPEHDRNVRLLAQGADLFIYDSQYTPLEYSNFKRGWGHSTWREGVNIAKETNVKQFILFHHDPDHNDVFVDSILGETRKIFPNSMASWEGLEIDLAAGQQNEPQEMIERRLGRRQQLEIPVRVVGTRPDGTTFEEVTCLENLSVRGGFFILENDPDTNEPLQVELHTSRDGTTLHKSIVSTRVTRNLAVTVGKKTKRGIGVSF
ncbi:MAG: MBL fold metallo-hydrolase [Acidobacteria bacterium]|nr:MBL fold metallo-hydrolase [Acidobacteriota bacterium]